MQENFTKKIRILSFQNAHNFGAVLQAYGLQQTLINMGYKDVKFLNYNPKYLSNRYNPFRKLTFFPLPGLMHYPGHIIRWLIFAISSVLRNYRFNESIKRLLFQTKKELHKLSDFVDEEADIIICGSDQIWNTSLTGSFDDVFFGKIPCSGLKKVISYAPSTELSSLNEKRAKELVTRFEGFSNISVREQPVKEYLSQYTDAEISVCVDPTIVCGREIFDKIVAPRKVHKPYICVYAYEPHGKLVQELIETIPNYHNYEVHYLLLGARGLSNLSNVYHSEISIEEFLSYIKYADYIITNSFHGLAFSLLFEKQFNVAFEDGKFVRCQSLLQAVDLVNRFVTDPQYAKWDVLDYKTIKERLSEIRKSSMNFLIKSL